MKAIGHHLYDRNTHLYYRSAFPRTLHQILGIKEIRLSLNTTDKAIARLLVAKLDIELQDILQSGYSQIKNAQTIPEIQSAKEAILKRIEELQSFNHTPKPNTLNSDLLDSYFRTQKHNKQLFSEVAQEYLKECITNAPKTIDHKKTTYKLFESICGNLPLHKINKKTARLFKLKMLECPANITKANNIQDINWDNLPRNNKKQSHVTVNNRIGAMTSLFTWAVNNDLIQNNPFSGLMIKNAKQNAVKRPSFDQSSLNTLFNSPIYTGNSGKTLKCRLIEGSKIYKDHIYWIPLIGLYTGMRLNEICQLEKCDIKKQDDVWIFDLSQSNHKQLKTPSSRRSVPIHNQLLNLGLLEYVEITKDGRLFKELPKRKDGTYSHKFTKQFTIILTELKLKQGGLCFHSFRHTFIDGLRNAGVERSIIMRLVGHSNSKDIHSNYGDGHNIKVLQNSINQLGLNSTTN